MTAHYNATVWGYTCTRNESVQKNDGEVNGTPRNNSMRIMEPIQPKELELPQLLMPINQPL
jgi:hypothetical protein